MNLQLTRQIRSIAGHQFTIEFPASQDCLLDCALESEESGSENADPYWGVVWDAAPKTAAVVLRHAWKTPLDVLDLGCGIGLVGIAALRAGHRVTFSDHASVAVATAISNAALNGFPGAPGLIFDWRQPPDSVFDFVVASDVLYEVSSHASLLATLHKMLSQNGVAWIGDSGRANSFHFEALAARDGWELQRLNEAGVLCSGTDHQQFRILVLSHRTSESGEQQHLPLGRYEIR